MQLPGAKAKSEGKAGKVSIVSTDPYPTGMKAVLCKLLGGLVGNRMTRILVGPAGVHYDFAANNREQEAFGILGNTSVTIHSKAKARLFACGAYPPFSCEEDLRRLLLGLIVTAAEFDEESYSARIILDEKLLLSLTPNASDKKVYWTIYEFVRSSGTRNISRGCVVTSTNIEAVNNCIG
jgi:hypothetical protein